VFRVLDEIMAGVETTEQKLDRILQTLAAQSDDLNGRLGETQRRTAAAIDEQRDAVTKVATSMTAFVDSQKVNEARVTALEIQVGRMTDGMDQLSRAMSSMASNVNLMMASTTAVPSSPTRSSATGAAAASSTTPAASSTVTGTLVDSKGLGKPPSWGDGGKMSFQHWKYKLVTWINGVYPGTQEV